MQDTLFIYSRGRQISVLSRQYLLQLLSNYHDIFSYLFILNLFKFVTASHAKSKGSQRLITLKHLVSDHQGSPCNHLSLVVRKPAFCICENKDADQLRDNREADRCLCFRYPDSTILLLSKFQSSGHLLWLHGPVCVRLGRKP